VSYEGLKCVVCKAHITLVGSSNRCNMGHFLNCLRPHITLVKVISGVICASGAHSLSELSLILDRLWS